MDFISNDKGSTSFVKSGRFKAKFVNLTPLIQTTTWPFGHQMPPFLTQELHAMKHVSCGISSARQYLWRRPNKKKVKVKLKNALSFVFRFELLRLSLTWRWNGPLYLASSAGVFFGRANVNANPNPSPVSFFRPRTYPKGYYFYSPQSSSVTKAKMAATTIRT